MTPTPSPLKQLFGTRGMDHNTSDSSRTLPPDIELGFGSALLGWRGGPRPCSEITCRNE